jgi:hypothetical protein
MTLIENALAFKLKSILDIFAIEFHLNSADQNILTY